MGHDTQNGAPQPAQPGDRTQEPYKPYTEYTSEHLGDLIERYWDSVIASATAEADPATSKELSIRLLKWAGVGEEQWDAPLIVSSGPAVRKDGTPLALSDYIEYAAGHHGDALPGIFQALQMEPHTPEYEAARKGMQQWFKVGED